MTPKIIYTTSIRALAVAAFLGVAAPALADDGSMTIKRTVTPVTPNVPGVKMDILCVTQGMTLAQAQALLATHYGPRLRPMFSPAQRDCQTTK